MSTEELIQKTWSTTVRPLVAEAWAAYGAGAYRACIAMTWAATCADLVEKVIWLADDGEALAVPTRDRVLGARAAGLAGGVQAMQQVERDLVSLATRLDVIDTVAAMHLERLREDRNLCVHPSLRGLGETFEPTAEYARAHLNAALEAVLSQPPTQGRRALERFTAFVTDPTFDPEPKHLLPTYFDRARPAARRALLDVAAKHAVLEVSGPESIVTDASTLASRFARCLEAFATRDHDAVVGALAKTQERFGQQSGEVQLGTLARLGSVDAFWDALNEAMDARLDRLVASAPIADFGPLSEDVRGALASIANAQARSRLPSLTTRLEVLRPAQQAQVVGARVHPYFLDHLVPMLERAGGWRSAETITSSAVVPYGPLLDLARLGDLLSAWAENEQCRTAGLMRQLAIELHEATPQLRGTDGDVWDKFLSEVRVHEDLASGYRYTELEQHLATST